jgi:NTP pyrophosphatase (non-canonical NTP hydrolase)
LAAGFQPVFLILPAELASVKRGKRRMAMTEEERAVFQKALDTWGGDAQILCLLEEMAELQDALCKHKRGRRTTDDIAEEIADVEIMLNQMKLYFRVEEEVKAQRARKVGRVEERLRSRTNRA